MAAKKKVAKKATRKKSVKKATISSQADLKVGKDVDQKAKKTLLKAMKNKGWDGLEPFKLADKVLQADREVALAAVKEGGWALKYADKVLQADREVVLAAVDALALLCFVLLLFALIH